MQTLCNFSDWVRYIYMKQPKYKTFNGAIRGARTLLVKLQARIDNDPSKFCENYGQSEIREFEDRLSDLHYQDKCAVMTILYRVSSMKPQV